MLGLCSLAWFGRFLCKRMSHAAGFAGSSAARGPAQRLFPRFGWTGSGSLRQANTRVLADCLMAALRRGVNPSSICPGSSRKTVSASRLVRDNNTLMCRGGAGSPGAAPRLLVRRTRPGQAMRGAVRPRYVNERVPGRIVSGRVRKRGRSFDQPRLIQISHHTRSRTGMPGGEGVSD
jgi:hypothetical protein